MGGRQKKELTAQRSLSILLLPRPPPPLLDSLIQLLPNPLPSLPPLFFHPFLLLLIILDCISINDPGNVCVNTTYKYYIHWGDNNFKSWYLGAPFFVLPISDHTLLTTSGKDSSFLYDSRSCSTTGAAIPTPAPALGRRPAAVWPLTRSWVPSAPVATPTLATALTIRTTKTTALV